MDVKKLSEIQTEICFIIRNHEIIKKYKVIFVICKRIVVKCSPNLFSLHVIAYLATQFKFNLTS